MCCTDEDFDNIIENQRHKCDLPVFGFFFHKIGISLFLTSLIILFLLMDDLYSRP